MTILSAPAAVLPAEICFHCGTPVACGVDHGVRIAGLTRAMCCVGCAAVAQAIVAAGLGEYYRIRTQAPVGGADIVPRALRDLTLYDHAAVQRRFVHVTAEHRCEATLILEGIVCAACVWLNERQLVRLPGVLAAHINYTTQRAQVVWDARVIHLSAILAAIEAIGYRAYPYEPQQARQLLDQERRRRLRELAVAGVFGMQVMMLAEALYAGGWFGIEPEFKIFFHWLSLLLTLPILFYSAAPFFRGAWRDARVRRVGMDVPVVLGITLAFGASVWATLTGKGEVYYDAVAMFVFFLLVGRYFEFAARRRAQQTVEGLAPALPALATRVQRAHGNETLQQVAQSDLCRGDWALVVPGAAVPADGRVVRGHSHVDESLLTGESTPRPRRAGDTVVAGSTNIESPLTIEVERTGAETVMADIQRLLARAQAEKPRSVQRAARAANFMVLGVLLFATLAGMYWWQVAPAQALPIVVAMLVVTCPCALALATPVAVTIAMHRLARRGLLVTRAPALERLAQATHVVFDKTGTLTYGRPRVLAVHPYATHDSAQSVELAARLAAHSEHPLARALCAAAGARQQNLAQAVRNTPGAGLEGMIDGEHYVLGAPSFVTTRTGLTMVEATLANLQASGNSVVVLASARALEAAFILGDEIRPEASALVTELTRTGKSIWLLTGDHAQAAARVARATGIRHAHAGLSPQDKVARVQQLQQAGAVVAMVGDGVNDAAALAAADVSIAMGEGTRLAHSAADIVLLSPRLDAMGDGIAIARAMQRTIRHNIAFALGYNVVALPLAAAGWITPWLGALGMSLSSLAVTANALRLARR